jgi:hypothetical protein
LAPATGSLRDGDTLDTDEFQLRGLRVPVYFETKLNRLTDTFHERIE